MIKFSLLVFFKTWAVSVVVSCYQWTRSMCGHVHVHCCLSIEFCSILTNNIDREMWLIGNSLLFSYFSFNSRPVTTWLRRKTVWVMRRMQAVLTTLPSNALALTVGHCLESMRTVSETTTMGETSTRDHRHQSGEDTHTQPHTATRTHTHHRRCTNKDCCFFLINKQMDLS